MHNVFRAIFLGLVDFIFRLVLGGTENTKIHLQWLDWNLKSLLFLLIYQNVLNFHLISKCRSISLIWLQFLADFTDLLIYIHKIGY